MSLSTIYTEINQKHDQTDSNWTKFLAKQKPKSSSFQAFSNIPSVQQFPECYYAMKVVEQGQPRGRCVILNYERFVIFEKSRKGSKHDVKALKRTFSTIGFEVIEHHSLTVRETEKVLDFGKR